MPKHKRSALNLAATLSMFLLGSALLLISALYVSSFLAIIGAAFIFWGSLLLYITPIKHVPLSMLTAVAEAGASNIERILTEYNLTEKGVYLPPKNLQNIEYSLIFVPRTPKTQLPTPEKSDAGLFTKEKNGVLITPPGLVLSTLFEEELGASFTTIDINRLQNVLPKLLVEEMSLAQSVKIQIQGNAISLEIAGSIFEEVCRQNDSLPKSHFQVGCILSSAIGCALAKVTGKPITIQNETRTQETNTTLIEYSILEE